jgi:hypothetical protein
MGRERYGCKRRWSVHGWPRGAPRRLLAGWLEDVDRPDPIKETMPCC